MANLCGAAGLTTQKIKDLASSTDTSERQAYEEHYRASISGAINEFWKQESYNVHFRIEKEKLSISISDSTYSRKIAPSDRSDGFQWYLSFYCALLNEVSTTETRILLLDNPALELHADGGRDIKRFLEERLSPTTQVIYVTHSPAMIDPYNLEQLRKVELKGETEGSKVEEFRFDSEKDSDLLEPVRSAIGASLVSSLIFNKFNVLVEGAADKPILEGAFAVLQKQIADKVLTNGPVSERGEFLSGFYQRAGLPFVVFLDADSRGRELGASLKKWGISDEKILDLRVVLSDDDQKKHPETDFELEDVMSTEFYHQAVVETYPKQTVDLSAINQETAGKRTRKYEEAYRKIHSIGFNKRRVAETVKKLLLEGKGDTETLNKLDKVTSAIWKALETQTTSKKAA
jgi:predicted ATP-dependent endonuclease of OLD family